MLRRSKLCCSTFVAAIGLGLSATLAAAQGLSGAVRDSVSRLPIAGAVLTLLDSSGATVARNLSNERGEYRFAVTRAARSVRVVRIGFQLREVTVPVGTRDNAPLDIRMLRLPTMLQAARVIASGRCPVRKDAAAALGLWEQARAGLLATIVAREENPALMHRLLFTRKMDGNSDRIASMSVSADSIFTTKSSFSAVHSAQDFARFGFATDSSSNATFFAPDADVLLSEAFVGAYCFQLAGGDRARPNDVGLHFVPVDRQRGRIDIDGTLWIDTVARVLRDIEFQYLFMPPVAAAFHPGGVVSFRAMQNGVVLVDRWSLRLVNATEDTTLELSSRGGAFYPSERDHLYAEETGGELARATWPDGLVWNAPLGAVRLQATTAAARPATGSIVALVATPYFGVVDSTGRVAIDALIPGPYAVRIVDPRIAVLGAGVPTTLKFTAVRDSTITAVLRVPTAEEMIAERCLAVREWTVGASVFVFGKVVSPDGKPVSNASVKFISGTYENPDSFVTGTDGLFQSCRPWHRGEDVTIFVRRSGMKPHAETRTFDTNLLVVRIVIQPLP
jgi:hypothetical protein